MKGREVAMLITIGVLLYVNVYLESTSPAEYSPLPAVVVSEKGSKTEEKTWENVADTTFTSPLEGQARLRVRVEIRGKGRDAGQHAAFRMNRESWIDGKDGWLYYRKVLKKNETAAPVCLEGYTDRQGTEDNVYASVVCEWKTVDRTA